MCAFVRDFIITQLIGEDIDAIFPITSAMTRLVGLLEKKGQGEPISRLLEHCGQATAVSCYFVGIYSDNELIGKGKYYADVTYCIPCTVVYCCVLFKEFK